MMGNYKNKGTGFKSGLAIGAALGSLRKAKKRGGFKRGMTTGVLLGSAAVGAGMLLKDKDMRMKVKDKSTKTFQNVRQGLFKSQSNPEVSETEEKPVGSELGESADVIQY